MQNRFRINGELVDLILNGSPAGYDSETTSVEELTEAIETALEWCPACQEFQLKRHVQNHGPEPIDLGLREGVKPLENIDL
jgi:hypothetical protein